MESDCVLEVSASAGREIHIYHLSPIIPAFSLFDVNEKRMDTDLGAGTEVEDRGKLTHRGPEFCRYLLAGCYTHNTKVTGSTPIVRACIRARPQGRLPQTEAVQRAGGESGSKRFIHLFFETGFNCRSLASLGLTMDQAGFKLTDIHLPLPPNCWGLTVCSPTPSNFQVLKY